MESIFAEGFIYRYIFLPKVILENESSINNWYILFAGLKYVHLVAKCQQYMKENTQLELPSNHKDWK